jgi:hypothetical protein
MFRDTSGATFDTVKPYVNRALHDDDVRRNVLRAFTAARKVYGELAGEDAIGVANKFSKKGDVRENLDTTVQSLSEALVRMSGKSPRKHRGWGPVLLLALLALALFNPATGASTRTWLKDHLFGSEEEFDYGMPTY